MSTGPRNLITDVSGLFVGNSTDARVGTGTTVLTAAQPFTAGVHVMGGAPGTTETDLLAPDRLIQQVDALVLSGGSAYGLAATDGVRTALRAQGRGVPIGATTVPIVPGAILNDLQNGGQKDWPDGFYAKLGAQALSTAASDFELGTIGAGTGATTLNLKGGLGSASVMVGDITVGALVAVNAVGAATVGDGPCFWAAPFEEGDEFGQRGMARTAPAFVPPVPIKGAGEATTIAIVATDAELTQAQATRLAVAAQDGIARALSPSHSLFDGDLVFAAATGARALPDQMVTQYQLGHAASVCLARAIARGVYLARSDPHDRMPCWQDQHGQSR